MKNYIWLNRFWVLLGLIGAFSGLSHSEMAQAKQHEIVDRVKAQLPDCHHVYWYEPTIIKSSIAYKLYTADLIRSTAGLPAKDLERTTKELNMIPVNNCVLRGNHKHISQQELLQKLEVNNVINLDSLAHVEGYGRHRMNYVYYPIKATKYPYGDSKQNLLKALTALTESKPDKKTYISCFFGKHRSGLVVGMYQFLQLYASDPENICQTYATRQDPAFVQMEQIAAVGALTYAMPTSLENFYRDFAHSVCEEMSEEFIETGKK